MKGRRSAFPIKAVVATLIFGILLSALLYLGYALANLDFFKIRYIISSRDNPIDFSYLQGRNIFKVDLKKESLRLSGLYPGYKKIKLVRVFPDRIFVNLLERKALAYLKLHRYFCVDESLVLFDLPKEMEEVGLTLILGVDRRIYDPTPGARVNLKELALAIDIIKEARINPILRDYQIKTISVPSLNNASFSIAGGPEVKISGNDIKSKIAILSSLVNQEKNNLGSIRYIDLRFREPVIKLKSAD